MSEQTKIEWCDHTFNPWMGCAKVSPGCSHCYAETLMDTRYGRVKWGKGKARQRTSAANWKLPVKWNLGAIKYPFRCSICRNGYAAKPQYDGPFFCPHCSSGDNPVAERTVARHRPRVFCASLADWLDDEVPIEWLADLLKLIHDTPNLDWLLLTKRPENFLLPRLAQVLDYQGKREGFPKKGKLSAFGDWLVRWCHSDPARGIVQSPPANVWVGVSVEDQTRADERIPALLQIPARVRFLSVEPLLGPVDLLYSAFNGADSLQSMHGIHWVIVGGESGPVARACNVEWIRSVVRQCDSAGVPCFVKQLGSNPERWPKSARDFSDFGRGKPFKHPKGGDMAEWPADLRVRQFPSIHNQHD